MGVSPPENHSKIGGDDDFDVISRKIFRDFSTDFFENKGPPLCFFEKSSKIAKLNPGANLPDTMNLKNSRGSESFGPKYTIWRGCNSRFCGSGKKCSIASPLNNF